MVYLLLKNAFLFSTNGCLVIVPKGTFLKFLFDEAAGCDDRDAL